MLIWSSPFFVWSFLFIWKGQLQTKKGELQISTNAQQNHAIIIDIILHSLVAENNWILK